MQARAALCTLCPVLKPWPLVGRRSELDAVEAALSRPGLGGVVFSGAAGVGKTRLATECLRLGEAAGFVTASALATRAAATIPLAALAPLLPAEPDADIGWRHSFAPHEHSWRAAEIGR